MNKWVFKALVMAEQSQLVRSIPDKTYISFEYFLKTHRVMNWRNPTTYNEKLNWLKVYDRNSEYSALVDKYEFKRYVTLKLGEGYTFPTLGVWNRFEEVDLNSLPNSFVLKCTHDSGGIWIVKDKNQLDVASCAEFFNVRLSRNYYYHGRQWIYKDINPRIIAEPYMTDESGVELKDYKFFCFDGEPRIIFVDYDRQIHHHRNVYSIDWNLMDVETKYLPAPGRNIPKPDELDKMIAVSRKLSAGMRHVRVDMYVVNGNIYVGELTFFHGNGCSKFKPAEFAVTLGDYINLR